MHTLILVHTHTYHHTHTQASRWDLYLYMGDDQIHWFSIINSLAIVLLLTGIVAMIMMRTLRRDFNRCTSRSVKFKCGYDHEEE